MLASCIVKWVVQVLCFCKTYQPEAFKLATGWNSRRLCHVCTSVDWHDPTKGSQWYRDWLDGSSPSPLKPGVPPPLMRIPGCDAPRYMTMDFCHAFHLGYGLDMGSSTIVLLAKLGMYEGRGLGTKLHSAFCSYITWCHTNGKVTSISDFSLLDFDMSSTLGIFIACFLTT